MLLTCSHYTRGSECVVLITTCLDRVCVCVCVNILDEESIVLAVYCVETQNVRSYDHVYAHIMCIYMYAI